MNTFNTTRKLAGPALALLLAAVPAPAALRELSTDRPDATESPFTVDAGHWQLEMDFLSHTRNRLDGVRTRAWDFAPLNLRYGLLSDIEVGIFISPYSRVTEEPRGGPRTKMSGFGDITLRAKFNFLGNDGGGKAFGLIADLKLPTAANGLGNGRVEGALILPVAFDLGGGWEMGAMTGVDLRQRDGGGTRAVWVNTATVGHELVRDLSGYLELTSQAGEGTHVATFNLGVTWRLAADTQLDAGVNLGVSRAADDAQFFAGLSRRF
jgi:hypothetical protein